MARKSKGISLKATVRKAAFSAVIYNIWAERNRRAFRNEYLDPNNLLKKIVDVVVTKLNGAKLLICDNGHARKVVKDWGLVVHWKASLIRWDGFLGFLHTMVVFARILMAPSGWIEEAMGSYFGILIINIGKEGFFVRGKTQRWIWMEHMAFRDEYTRGTIAHRSYATYMHKSDRRHKTTQRSVKISKPTVTIPNQSCQCIFELSSPVRLTDKEKSEMNTDERYGVLLEACYYCKKKFDEKDDIFMYRYLRAFCTPECREEQMALDKEVENNPKESLEEIEVMEQWINKLKGRFGAH
ncbi:hypothetical protein HHK36_020586 [Tetracentron sinense]|uniref:FLZ-type domain-containing protein n=1 Tax=Tetracentron sinense TaxID=13715 RepID=A0A835D8H8_TETSI|nr:hypothetical protein HHK36_020586 [Tetracentron sinense]